MKVYILALIICLVVAVPAITIKCLDRPYQMGIKTYTINKSDSTALIDSSLRVKAIKNDYALTGGWEYKLQEKNAKGQWEDAGYHTYKSTTSDLDKVVEQLLWEREEDEERKAKARETWYN